MDPILLTFVISYCAGLSIKVKFTFLEFINKKNVKEQILLCFNKALESWSPNISTRRKEKKDLLKNFELIINNPNLTDDVLLTNTKVKSFYNLFELEIAKPKYQAAYNYLKAINDKVAYEKLDTKLSAILTKLEVGKIDYFISEDKKELLIWLSQHIDFFNLDLIKYLQSYLKINESHTLTEWLKKIIIVNEDDKSQYKISSEILHEYEEMILQADKTQILAFYGSYYHQLAFNKASGDKNTVDNIIKSINHWHKSKNFERTKRIIKSYIPKFKLVGHYEDLSRLIKFQIENDKSSKNDTWLNFNYAHTNYLLGNLEESLKSIRPQLYKFKPLKYGDEKIIREHIKLELKIYLLYTELLSAIGQSEDAIQILLGKINIIVKQDYSISQLDWQVISQSISNLSWYFIEKKDYETALRILNKLKKPTLLIQNDRSIAVLKARIGIAHFYSSQFDDSMEELIKSLYLFQKVKDERGIAWVCGYLVSNYLIDNNVFNSDLVTEYFTICLTINSNNNLFDMRYYEILKTLKKNVTQLNLNDENLELLNDELRRQEILNQRIKKSIKKEEYVKIFNVVIRSIENEDADMYDLINRFLDKKTIKIKTYYFKSYLRKVKKNAEKILENLFSSYDKKEIFLNPQLNKLITEATKFDETGLDNHVIPNIEYINKNTSDSIKMHYARTLEKGSRQKFALEILCSMDEENEEFYNLKGNCLREIDRKESLSNYSKALELSILKFDRAKYLNNMAWLIYDTRWKTMYKKGLEYCEMSLTQRKFSHYSWPYSLRCLLLLKIDIWQTSEVVAETLDYLEENNINNNILKDIVSSIHNKNKAHKIQLILDTKMN